MSTFTDGWEGEGLDKNEDDDFTRRVGKRKNAIRIFETTNEMVFVSAGMVALAPACAPCTKNVQENTKTLYRYLVQSWSHYWLQRSSGESSE